MKIRKNLTITEIEKLDTPFIEVDSINGISTDSLREQIAFREHKEIKDITKITIDDISVTYNDNIFVGFIEEYYPTLEQYKKSIM